MKKMANFFAPLSKVDKQDDGTLRIYGVASSESVDEAGEIIKASAMQAALPDFFKHGGTGALRVMHQPVAAGRVDEAEVDDGVTSIVATVVDADAIFKIEKGVLRGFSVGGRVLERDPKNPKIIVKIALTEVSLVDRPCNGDATFSLWKAAGVEPEEPAQSDDDGDRIVKALAVLTERLDEAIAIYNERFAAIEGGRDEAVRKVAGGVEPLLKVVNALRDENADLAKRIAYIEAQPMPPKTAGPGVAISKEADVDGASRQRAPAPSTDDVAKMLTNMPSEERALLLTKAALTMPLSVSSFGGGR